MFPALKKLTKRTRHVAWTSKEAEECLIGWGWTKVDEIFSFYQTGCIQRELDMNLRDACLFTCATHPVDPVSKPAAARRTRSREEAQAARPRARETQKAYKRAGVVDSLKLNPQDYPKMHPRFLTTSGAHEQMISGLVCIDGFNNGEYMEYKLHCEKDSSYIPEDPKYYLLIGCHPWYLKRGQIYKHKWGKYKEVYTTSRQQLVVGSRGINAGFPIRFFHENPFWGHPDEYAYQWVFNLTKDNITEVNKADRSAKIDGKTVRFLSKKDRYFEKIVSRFSEFCEHDAKGKRRRRRALIRRLDNESMLRHQ